MHADRNKQALLIRGGDARCSSGGIGKALVGVSCSITDEVRDIGQRLAFVAEHAKLLVEYPPKGQRLRSRKRRATPTGPNHYSPRTHGHGIAMVTHTPHHRRRLAIDQHVGDHGAGHRTAAGGGVAHASGRQAVEQHVG
ncbi:hypothetical protein D3C77_603140 [compost metagenome]